MYAGKVKMREIVCYLGAGLRAQLYEKNTNQNLSTPFTAFPSRKTV